MRFSCLISTLTPAQGQEEYEAETVEGTELRGLKLLDLSSKPGRGCIGWISSTGSLEMFLYNSAGEAIGFEQRQTCISISGLPSTSMVLGNLVGFSELKFPFLSNRKTTFSSHGCH